MARSTGRTVWAGLALVVVALLVTGCGEDEVSESQATDSTGPDATPRTTARADEASDALARYGLDLPAQATETELAVLPDQEDDGMEDVYRVTFTAPVDAVEQMCQDAGIAGPLVVSGLTDDELELYGVDGLPDGAWSCSASRPSDYRQQLRVLFWGDPASVVVALYTMPVR